MAKNVSFYVNMIKGALREAGKYSKGLTAQIMSLAGALRTLDLANDEIDKLETTTVETISRYGNTSLAPHPVFKIQKDAQDSVTRQMKALGLTAFDLSGSDEADPLRDLTKKVLAAGQKKSVVVKRGKTQKEDK